MSEREWQPIETAPKDGTRILVFGDGDVYLVQWNYSEPMILNHDAKGWVTDSAGPEYNNTIEAPTHWQPLPPPPSPIKEE